MGDRNRAEAEGRLEHVGALIDAALRLAVHEAMVPGDFDRAVDGVVVLLGRAQDLHVLACELGELAVAA